MKDSGNKIVSSSPSYCKTSKASRMKGSILNKLSCHVSGELRFGIKSVVKGKISTVTQPFFGCHATLPPESVA